MSLKDYVFGIAGGALIGGSVNGSIAALKGNNFWTGKEIQFGKGKHYFPGKTDPGFGVKIKF